jgi:hypothetical protein
MVPQLEDARARAVVSSEVLRVYPDRGAVPPGSWYEFISSAKVHVDVLVYAGLILSDGRADLAALLQRKAEEGVSIRLLLGDPASEAVARRGAEERVGDAMAARIRLSMSYIEPAFGVPGGTSGYTRRRSTTRSSGSTTTCWSTRMRTVPWRPSRP